MTQSDDFVYDVRVRRRMLHRGAISDAEVKQRGEALKDLTDECEDVSAKQPALVSSGDRASVPTPGLVGAEVGSDDDWEGP